MKRSKRQPHELSLLELLQEAQNRTSTETIPADQRQSLLQMTMCILQACAKATGCPSPKRDMREIRGQWHVKRALEVAAAGSYNILLIGPNGAGKAQLTRTLPSLLPTTSLPYPLREPLSSIEKKAFIGEPTIPGELTLAHRGVLFLKDLDAFDLSVLTSLTQTVETHGISIPLQEGSVVLPAQFILVATVKPCPCGFFGDPGRSCLCSAEEIALYRQPLKEIIRTCFAIEIEVPLIGDENLGNYSEEGSATIRQRVEAAREIQHRRYAETTHLRVNADLRAASDVERHCKKVSTAEDLLKSALRQLHLTPLEVLRVQTVARTIADLDGSALIAGKHFAEAIRYLSGFVRDK